MRFLTILITILLISSCDKGPKVVEFSHPEGYYKEVYEINDDSIKHGKYLKYFQNGVLSDSCDYINGEIHGSRKIFTETGNLEINETYDQGNFHGPYTTFYNNGQNKKIQNYLDNKIQGEVKEFFENGNLKALIQFIDNLENGPFQEYYENGNIHWEGYYQNGDFEQDTLKEYNVEGEIIRKLLCDKGVCQTVWTPEKGYRKAEKIFEN